MSIFQAVICHFLAKCTNINDENKKKYVGFYGNTFIVLLSLT